MRKKDISMYRVGIALFLQRCAISSILRVTIGKMWLPWCWACSSKIHRCQHALGRRVLWVGWRCA